MFPALGIGYMFPNLGSGRILVSLFNIYSYGVALFVSPRISTGMGLPSETKIKPDRRLCFPARHWLRVPALNTGCKLVACFLALSTGCRFFRAWHWLHVFPRLTMVANGLHVFCAWHWLHVFPRLTLVANWLHVFLCLALVACFSALGTGYMFSRAWHRLFLLLIRLVDGIHCNLLWLAKYGMAWDDQFLYSHDLPAWICYETVKTIQDSNLYSLLSGIMAGSPCPIEVMKQVMTKLHMPRVTVSKAWLVQFLTLQNVILEIRLSELRLESYRSTMTMSVLNTVPLLVHKTPPILIQKKNWSKLSAENV